MKTTGIVAFAFGAPDVIRSNQRIAQIASQKARELNAPVYTQLDILIEAIAPEIKVTYTDEKPGNPPPTLRIARGAIEWAKRQRLTELLVVAAKPHLWRCVRDLTQSVREAGVPILIRFCKEIEQFPEDEWYCPDSTQLRARSQKDWQSRERILKLMPFFIYKLIAS